MILVPEDEERLKEKELEAESENKLKDANVDPPPVYTALAHTSADPNFSPLPPPAVSIPPLSSPSKPRPGASKSTYVERDVSSGPSTFNNVPNIKPSNFVRVSQANSGVKGAWLIDPAVSIPPSFLPSLDREIGETEETRRSLFINSKNGPVDGDIHILPTSQAHKDRLRAGNRTKTYISATSTNGSVSTKLHDVMLDNDDSRLPVYLHCASRNGNIAVYLPRSFHGSLNVKVQNGNVRFSEALKGAMTTLSTEDGVRRSFLGGFEATSNENGFQDGKWLGDELHVDSRNGNVRICFENEAESFPGRFNLFNIFGKMFSL